MISNKFIILLAISGATLGLVGCCVNDNKCPNDAMISSQDKTPINTTHEATISPQEQAMLAKKELHFSFNSHDLNTEAKEVIAVHASVLLKNPAQRLRVIGHTDKRGSQKYNIALGMLRAKAVAKVLEHNGVPADRISLSSYGKDKPAVIGNNEQAWAQNRRAELVYEENN